MPTIKPNLLKAIMEKTELSRAQVYARIKQTASSEYLPRHLAAIKGSPNHVVGEDRAS
jgi:hypothetical protein